MSVQYNISVFDALKKVYGSKSDGFSDEDFETNEKNRGIVLPYTLKNFLKDYAYLSVNRQSSSVKFFHPNLMSVMRFSEENVGNVALLIIGRVGEYQVSVKNETADDPQVYLIKLGSKEETKVLASDDVISELIKVMMCHLLLGMKGAVTSDDAEDTVKRLRENGVDLEKIENDPSLSREYSFNFCEETRTFVIAEFVSGELSRFFFVTDENFS